MVLTVVVFTPEYQDGGELVNWDQMEGKWKQLKGSLKERWGKLTDDDLNVISGNKDKLIGRLQERYGYNREEAERQSEEWARSAGTSAGFTRSTDRPFDK